VLSPEENEKKRETKNKETLEQHTHFTAKFRVIFPLVRRKKQKEGETEEKRKP